jgi:MFS family permease
LVQGIEGLPGLSLFFYMKEKLGFTPEKIMYIGSICGIPWLVKPMWGYLCDNYLTKKIWILISLTGSLGICLYLGLGAYIILPILIIAMSIMNLTTAVRDVAVDGIMCVEGKETNSCDKIQSIQWMSITIAGILVSLAGGYIADHFNYRFAYLCLLPIYLLIIGIILKYRTNPPKQDCKNCTYYYSNIIWEEEDKAKCHQNEMANLFGFTEKGFRCGYYASKPKPKLLKTIYSCFTPFSPHGLIPIWNQWGTSLF